MEAHSMTQVSIKPSSNLQDLYRGQRSSGSQKSNKRRSKEQGKATYVMWCVEEQICLVKFQKLSIELSGITEETD